MLIRSYIPLVFLFASMVLLIFVNLCGATKGTSLSSLWWSDVTNETGKVRWTSYSICQVGADNSDINCTPKVAATPYSPSDIYIGWRVPVEFVERRTFYYYTSRFAFGGLLVSVIFSGLALLTVILDLTGIFHFRSLIIFNTSIALIFDVAAATCQTAAHVAGNQVFNKYGMPAKLGTTMFALMWASVATLLLSILLIPKTNLGKVAKKIVEESD